MSFIFPRLFSRFFRFLPQDYGQVSFLTQQTRSNVFNIRRELRKPRCFRIGCGGCRPHTPALHVSLLSFSPAWSFCNPSGPAPHRLRTDRFAHFRSGKGDDLHGAGDYLPVQLGSATLPKRSPSGADLWSAPVLSAYQKSRLGAEAVLERIRAAPKCCNNTSTGSPRSGCVSGRFCTITERSCHAPSEDAQIVLAGLRSSAPLNNRGGSRPPDAIMDRAAAPTLPQCSAY